MKTFRLHLSNPTFSNPGTENADFTGERYIDQPTNGDGHKTLVEFKIPDEKIEQLEEVARMINAESVKEVTPSVYVGIRAGIWDDEAPQ